MSLPPLMTRHSSLPTFNLPKVLEYKFSVHNPVEIRSPINYRRRKRPIQIDRESILYER